MVPCFRYSDPHHCSHKNPDILSLQPHIKEGYLLLLGTVLSPDFFPDLLGLNTELKNCSIFFLPSLFLQFLLFIPCLYLCQGFLILFFPFFLYTVAKFEAIFLGFDFVSQLRLFVLGGLLSLIIFVSSIFLDKLFLEKNKNGQGLLHTLLVGLIITCGIQRRVFQLDVKALLMGCLFVSIEFIHVTPVQGHRVIVKHQSL